MKTITFFSAFFLFLVSLTLSAQDRTFVHTTTAANISGYITTIDHPDLNGNSSAKIFIANRWEGIYNNQITSIWYTGSFWTIYNEDTGVDMTEGLKFNVYIADPANVITHEVTAGNLIGTSGSVIDDARLNNSNPGPLAVFTKIYPAYNNNNCGFWYEPTNDKRGIYTEGGDPLPIGAHFNILIAGAADATQIEHQTTATNNSGNLTLIDDAVLNGNPNATFVFSHYWGVNGASSEVLIDKVLGTYYNGSQWGIYTEDVSNMPEGLAFDIIVAPQWGLGIENSILEANLEAFPNPTTDFVTVKTDASIETIILFDILGKKIVTIEGIGNEMQLDLSNFQRGAYIAKVQSGGQITTLKLIKK